MTSELQQSIEKIIEGHLKRGAPAQSIARSIEQQARYLLADEFADTLRALFLGDFATITHSHEQGEE